MQFFKKKKSGITTHLYPPTTTTCPTFSLKKGLSSLFPPPSLLLKCSHTEAHCSEGPIHEAKRQWRKTQRAPHTAERTLSSALTPEGCVWAAPRHTGPADTSLGSSLLWAWPLAKLPKQPQTDLQLSITSSMRGMRMRNEVWVVISCCQWKTSEESLPCKMLATSKQLEEQKEVSGKGIAAKLRTEISVKRQIPKLNKFSAIN